MRIEDSEEYVDYIAQAVIDKIEERDRIAGMVDLAPSPKIWTLWKVSSDALSDTHLRRKA